MLSFVYQYLLTLTAILFASTGLICTQLIREPLIKTECEGIIKIAIIYYVKKIFNCNCYAILFWFISSNCALIMFILPDGSLDEERASNERAI